MGGRYGDDTKCSEDIESGAGVCPGLGQLLGTELGDSQRELLTEVVSLQSRKLIQEIAQKT